MYLIRGQMINEPLSLHKMYVIYNVTRSDWFSVVDPIVDCVDAFSCCLTLVVRTTNGRTQRSESLNRLLKK